MQPNRYSRMGSEIDVIQCYGGPSVALGVEMSADTMSLTAWNETRENPKTNIMLTIGGKFLNILSHPILSYPICPTSPLVLLCPICRIGRPVLCCPADPFLSGPCGRSRLVWPAWVD